MWNSMLDINKLCLTKQNLMQKQGPERIEGDPLLENFSATRSLIKSMQILLHPAGP